MSIQTLTPGFAELTPCEACRTQGGIVFTAALLIPWMGKAFIGLMGAAASKKNVRLLLGALEELLGRRPQ